MTEQQAISSTPLDAGWTALKEGDWTGAQAAFEKSLSEGETPEALEGMGWVGHMLNTAELTFDARERAGDCGGEQKDAHLAVSLGERGPES